MRDSSRVHSLRTLGRLVLLDGTGCEERSLSTRPRKLALLAWLALRPERRASRERLIGVFWGDRDEARARNSLSDALSHLRRVLGHDAISAHGTDVVLSRDASLEIDAVELASAAARGDHARVVDLYRGPFLDGFYIGDAPDFDDWCDRERARLVRAFTRSASVRCGELANAEAWEACRDVAERWLDAELAAPDAALMLLRASAAPATPAAYAGALSSYQSLVARLNRELGSAPAPEVRELANDIARRVVEAPVLPSVPLGVGEVVATANGDATPPFDAPSAARHAHVRARRYVVAAIAVIAVAAMGVAATRRAPRLDRHRVVVVTFQNQTGDSALSPLGAIAADWVSRGLVESHTVQVADPLSSASRMAWADPQAIGRRAGAGMVVVGAYARAGDSLTMSARLVDANTGAVLRTTQPATALLAQPILAVAATRERVFGALAAEIDPVIAHAAPGSVQPPTYEAYLAWVEGLDLFARRDYQGAIAPLLHAAAVDSQFVSPRIWAMAAYGNIGDDRHADSILQTVWLSRARLGPVDRGLVGVWHADLRGDRLEEYAAAHEMLANAPGSELSWYIAGYAALYANRPNEAAALLRRIPVDDSAIVWDMYGTDLAHALHIAGRYDEERRETARRLRHVPGSMSAMEDHGRALAAAGDARGAVDMVAAILESGHSPSESPGSAAFDIGDELLIHGHPAEARLVFQRVLDWRRARPAAEARTRFGTLVLLAALARVGALDSADSVARSALGTAPRYWRFLQWHGIIAAQRGDTAEARRTSDVLANLTTPYLRGSNTFARAQIAALLRDPDGATRLLRQAIAEGVSPLVIHATPEFLTLRGHPPYEALVMPGG